MEKELQALKIDQTWDYVYLPLGKQPIKSKWVDKIKYKIDDTMEWYKARLVAKGYSQVECKDFNESFALVAKLTTVQYLAALAATKG